MVLTTSEAPRAHCRSIHKPIAARAAQEPVGFAIVQRLRIGKDVVDVGLAIEQHMPGNRLATVDADAIFRLRVQILPKLQAQPIVTCVELSERLDEFYAALDGRPGLRHHLVELSPLI